MSIFLANINSLFLASYLYLFRNTKNLMLLFFLSPPEDTDDECEPKQAVKGPEKNDEEISE